MVRTLLSRDLGGTAGIPDTELVAAARAGSQEAFEVLVERYERLVLSVAFACSGNVSETEEIAQETFVAAWKQLDGLRDADSFRSWICGIARNLTRLAQRTEHNELARRRRARVEREGSTGAAPSALDEMITREERQVLWRALGAIPATYRMPLMLFYQEQLSIEQIARQLGLAETNVKSRLSRGRKMLTDEVIALIAASVPTNLRSRPAFRAAVLAAIGLAGARTAVAAPAAPAVRPTRMLIGAGATVMVCGVVAAVALHPIGDRFTVEGAALVKPPSPSAPPESATDLVLVAGARPEQKRGQEERRTVFSFDFEDGVQPEIFFEGQVAPCGGQASSRDCIMGTLRPSFPKRSVVLMKRENAPIFYYSPNMVLAFDYWLSCSANNGINIKFRNDDQAQNYAHFVPRKTMACDSWGHAELRLADFRPGSPRRNPKRGEAGDAVRSIFFAGGEIGGLPVMLDNISLVEYPPGDLPAASLLGNEARLSATFVPTAVTDSKRR
jgi:RNA polymerase sigma factor (sigma-70 family)